MLFNLVLSWWLAVEARPKRKPKSFQILARLFQNTYPNASGFLRFDLLFFSHLLKTL